MNALFRTEDWWAVWIGLLIFALSLCLLLGVDVLGWGVSAKEWTDISKAVAPSSATFANLTGWTSLLLTYVFLVLVLSAGASAMGWNVRRFLTGFTVIFAISYLCVILGHNAYIAATPNKRAAFHIDWSLGLTGEAGYILALLFGLAIGNFAPAVTVWLREATRPEWFIKTAIVIYGAGVGIKAAQNLNLATAIMFRGFAAIVEAYLIYWALVYFIARKFFKFSREWAAPLASGISICGVSAAIATGAAIRARPVVPIMVSSLVVIFAVVELLFLPFLAQATLYQEPLVAAAWMGLAVKTDGAAFAAGAITEALVRTKAATFDLHYQKEYMQLTTTTVKVFIDIFIGIWSFILALIWVYRIEPREGDKVKAIEIWERFPKFVLGYILTFVLMLSLALYFKPMLKTFAQASGEADIFRTIFFSMTFFTIGMTANFKKLWAEGIGRLALVYVISLFGFIIWIGLAISWLFFHGVPIPMEGVVK